MAWPVVAAVLAKAFGIGAATYAGGRVAGSLFGGDDESRPPASWGRRPGARGVLADGVGRTRIGRAAFGDDLTAAAEAESGAARSEIERALGTALYRTDLEYGQAGTFRSGARLERRGEMREAATRDLSNALARIELERAGIAQSGEAMELTAQLQREQMAMQRSMAQSQMQAGMIEAGVPVFMKYGLPLLLKLLGGGDDGGSFLEQAGAGWIDELDMDS